MYLALRITALLSIAFCASTAQAAEENRCGWFINPTPGNAWLKDRDGEWTVGIQGGEQTEGGWPSFARAQWVATNGSYGYGCACMWVTVDRKEMRVLTIKSARALPLATCRNDLSIGKAPE